MLINRRAYCFKPDLPPNHCGWLTVGEVTYYAYKTGKTVHAHLTKDTMTGKKSVLQYYDEFESRDKSHDLAGDSDQPHWLPRTKNPIQKS